MSRRDAALRGAATAALWAAVTLGLIVSLRDAWLRGVPPRGSPDAVAYAVLDIMRSTATLWVIAVVLFVSAVAGTAWGLLGRRLPLKPAARVAVLTSAAVPGAWLVVAAAWVLVFLPALLGESGSLRWIPLGALWMSGIAIFAAAPALAGPAIVASALLEGWTRPEALPRTGLARPPVRRVVTGALLALAAVLATLAVVRR